MSQQPQRIQNIIELHHVYGIAKPLHPLVSVINFDDIQTWSGSALVSRVFDLYTIAIKRNFSGKIKYGQQDYDFDEGIMTFMAPNQVLNISYDASQPARHSGWLFLFHPDFLWNTPLAKEIRQYEYFDYSGMKLCFYRIKKRQ